ncbi:MAG: beta-glucosidase BglX [Bacteroidetes bacterium]|nr:beta-glucosidase BglX [Bacteroidota bacterium]
MNQNLPYRTLLEVDNVENRIEDLIQQMTLTEKIGQMSQFSGRNGIPHDLRESIQQGKVGSILNEVNTDVLNEIQRIAVEESRLGIPLIVGRDVIHGFQTMFPIPLGQAASWNPEIIEEGARISATEAASVGINWTFAPMVDISRDPRWGRIAECLGEDPYLASILGSAMVKGFQGDDLSHPNSIAACAKHFAGYGYSEAGRDYAYVNISENELRNIVLPPFKACADAGVATFMSAFCDINGIPATGNELLMKQILRKEWDYKGFVVSDWDSVIELIKHGFAENSKEAAFEAIQAGIDMEMASRSYQENSEKLLEEGRINIEQINTCVRNILRIKFELGLFENTYTNTAYFPEKGNASYLQSAKQAAIESCVLLKNDYNTLPLKKDKVQNLAIIGPMADDGYEQMGTWTFDGKEEWCKTPLQSIYEMAGNDINIRYARGLETTRSKNRDGFEEALSIARESDTVVMFMGEEAILSGEAHCRADIDLPGFQNELLEEISKLGKSTILVVMAGRPLTLDKTQHYVNSLMYAWHPGTMGGPAIADLLFGEVAPSGKLPVSFPKMVGQIPIYYNHRNSGRPVINGSFMHIDNIPKRPTQTSLGNTSFHFDAGFDPLYPFGFGLSYTSFYYHSIELSTESISLGDFIEISAELTNTGSVEAVEVAQLYIRDLVGSVTRPVRELKGFQRVHLYPGETKTIIFRLHTDDLSFFDRKMKYVTEPGQFDVWIGGDSRANLKTSFYII